MKQFFCISVLAAFTIFATQAQSPVPGPVAPTNETLPVALKQLQELKTANEELLKKQEAALQRLEELQKAADEVKIFGKRS